MFNVAIIAHFFAVTYISMKLGPNKANLHRRKVIRFQDKNKDAFALIKLNQSVYCFSPHKQQQMKAENSHKGITTPHHYNLTEDIYRIIL